MDQPGWELKAEETPIAVTNITKIMEINRFRSMSHLSRVTALVLKFVKIMKGQKDSRAPLKVKDLIEAENVWLRSLQSEIYNREIQAIQGLRITAPLVRQLCLFFWIRTEYSELEGDYIMLHWNTLLNSPLSYHAYMISPDS
jgi:hypothetical protein